MNAPPGRHARALRPLTRVTTELELDPCSQEPVGREATLLDEAIATALAPLAELASPDDLAFLEGELRHAATTSPRLRRWLTLAALEASGEAEVAP